MVSRVCVCVHDLWLPMIACVWYRLFFLRRSKGYGSSNGNGTKDFSGDPQKGHDSLEPARNTFPFESPTRLSLSIESARAGRTRSVRICCGAPMTDDW